MFKVISVMIGGSLGALLRYLISGWVQNLSINIFPWGTLFVNIVGCFFIGLLSGLFMPPSGIEISTNLRILILTGFLGAFTTFSTYSLETLNLLRDNEIKLAIYNFLISNICGLLLVFVGMFISRLILTLAR